ncbi:hypothetical protein PMI31_04201 [Pseudomonas sp. GM55]|nr:hypothetical protein PMI31_04201 [Pseudomonas sp. GM55]
MSSLFLSAFGFFAPSDSFSARLIRRISSRCLSHRPRPATTAPNTVEMTPTNIVFEPGKTELTDSVKPAIVAIAVLIRVDVLASFRRSWEYLDIKISVSSSISSRRRINSCSEISTISDSFKRRQRLGDQPRIEGFYNEFVYFRFAGGLSAYEMHRKLRGTLALLQMYGVGNPRDLVSGRTPSLLNFSH